jgi:5'-nucleotidase
VKILLTNDDGYKAPGILHLFNVLRVDHDVTLVAPETEQSGIGHAFTFNRALSYRPFKNDAGVEGFAVAGTPSDCVKFAVSHLLPEKPDIVVSGINLGENSGTAGYYSGTVAAAREGAFWRIPSMAFSVCVEGRDHMAGYADIAKNIFEKLSVLHAGKAGQNGSIPVFYNVNFPGCRPDKVKGVRATRQSLAFFDDRYRREDAADGSSFFWLYGDKKDLEQSDLYDSRAIESGYIAITPLDFDSTATAALTYLSDLDLIQATSKEH